MARKSFTRRQFMKAAGCLGTLFGATPLGSFGSAQAGNAPVDSKIPKRPFGKTGIQVPVLALGGMFDTVGNQMLLRQAVRWGVTYWDTADCYGGGRSEKGIGRFFQRSPEIRKEIFLVTKSDSRSPRGMSRLLDRSLERMQTDWIDLYFLHAVKRIEELTPEVRRWAEKAKASGKIRLFGFSTHSNMAHCLLGAAELGWIDGIMFSYNFRLMHDKKLDHAVEACAEAGIGLTAMKTQGGGPIHRATPEEAAFVDALVRKGFTDKQAKVKVIWEDERIASVCSQMPTLTILMSNVAAALNQTRFGEGEKELFRKYAEATADTYCAGCSRICEEAAGIPVADFMRCLMYARHYEDPELARETARILGLDGYRRQLVPERIEEAASRCPQRLPLARLLQEARALVENPGTSRA